MALIHCLECNREVSDRAANCPHCGVPIAAVGTAGTSIIAPTTPVVIEKTSKKWKRHILIGFISALVILPFWLALGTVHGPDNTTAFTVFTVFTVALFVSAVYFFVAIIMAWWHHG